MSAPDLTGVDDETLRAHLKMLRKTVEEENVDDRRPPSRASMRLLERLLLAVEYLAIQNAMLQRELADVRKLLRHNP